MVMCPRFNVLLCERDWWTSLPQSHTMVTVNASNGVADWHCVFGPDHYSHWIRLRSQIANSYETTDLFQELDLLQLWGGGKRRRSDGLIGVLEDQWSGWSLLCLRSQGHVAVGEASTSGAGGEVHRQVSRDTLRDMLICLSNRPKSQENLLKEKRRGVSWN